MNRLDAVSSVPSLLAPLGAGNPSKPAHHAAADKGSFAEVLRRLQGPAESRVLPGMASANVTEQLQASKADADPVREVFDDFVGQAMFGQMLASMRKSLSKPAYFHGGQAEEVFQSEFDRVIVERVSDASAESLTDPMYELFKLQGSHV